jgi:hypothetical protein
MERIAKVSRIFRILFWIAFIVLPLFNIISWILVPESISFGSSIFGIDYTPIPSGLAIEVLTPGIQVLAFLVDMLIIAPNMLLLFWLIKLFSNYEQHKIFTLENVKLIRNVGYTLIVWQILTPIHQALLSLVLTLYNAPGHHIVEASFDSNNLAVILIAFIVILISWVMAVGHKLQEEQEYTV